MDNSETNYIGSPGNSFKERYTNHTSSFRNRKYEHSTTLSKFIWTLKDQKKAYNIEWKQIQKAPTYDKAIKKCKLCNAEKTQILFSIEPNLLNKRSELMNKCNVQLLWLWLYFCKDQWSIFWDRIWHGLLKHILIHVLKVGTGLSSLLELRWCYI